MYKMRHASEDCKRTDKDRFRDGHVKNRLFTLLLVGRCRTLPHWALELSALHVSTSPAWGMELE